MPCTCAPALKALRDEANRLWPHRDKASDGCCGDAAHAARKSDHNPDGDGMATAYDIDHDDTDGFDGFRWAERIRLRRDPRVKYVIFYGRIFSSIATPHRPAWEWGPYTGPNAHKSHMHVSVTQQAKRVIGPWFIDTTPQEDFMAALSDDEQRALALKVDGLYKVLIGNRVDGTDDDRGAAHDLATPILNTNHEVGIISRWVGAIADKLGVPR